jgi:DNA-binding NarL/FixJ family response regulator
MQDAIKHGTFNFRAGENHQLSKLKNEDIKEIRKLLHNGVMQKDISKQFNICATTISMIKSGKQWRHVA